MEKSPSKRIREMSPTGSFADPVVVNSSDEETETTDINHSDDLSLQSPPDHEKGHQPLKYVAKTPVYPPSEDSSENAEFRSIPDLQTPREQMSPDQENQKEPDHGTHMTAPADAPADMDHFDDTNRQIPLSNDWTKRQMEPHSTRMQVKRPWNEWKQLSKLSSQHMKAFGFKMIVTSLYRLNEAAKKLKDRHAEMKKDTIKGTHQQEDQVTPSDKCVTCNLPIEQHLLECSKNTLQHDLKEIIHEFPVESLTGPPKIVHAFPATRPQTLLMSPPPVPANFTVKLNKVAKMKTGPTSNEAKMVATMTTQPWVIIQKLSPEEIQSLSSSV